MDDQSQPQTLMGHDIRTITSSSRFKWTLAQVETMRTFLAYDPTMATFLESASSDNLTEAMLHDYGLPASLFEGLDLAICNLSPELRDIVHPKIIRKLVRIYNEE